MDELGSYEEGYIVEGPSVVTKNKETEERKRGLDRVYGVYGQTEVNNTSQGRRGTYKNSTIDTGFVNLVLHRVEIDGRDGIFVICCSVALSTVSSSR